MVHHRQLPSTLVLASASPRRRQLLAALERPFASTVADIDETARPGEHPVDYVLRMAETKARAAAGRIPAPVAGEAPGEARAFPGASTSESRVPHPNPPLVIGADTIVVHEGRILGKPSDRAEAAAILRSLRGRRHLVHTGLAVVDASTGRCRRDLATTGVWMRDYGDAEIEAYVAGGDPMDKAGAYAIQHPGFRPVARLEGSEANVIGLPVALLATLIARFERV